MKNARPQALDTPTVKGCYQMANIRENVKDGKIVSYRFTVCVGRDIRGKQIRKFATWTPPAGLSPSKERRAAERAAEDWEDEIRTEYQKEQEAKAQGIAYSLPPEKRRDDFIDFIQNTWIPLQVKSGNETIKVKLNSPLDFVTVLRGLNLQNEIINHFPFAVYVQFIPMRHIVFQLLYIRLFAILQRGKFA